MKLTDISKVSADVLNAKMEARVGWKLPLSELSVAKANVMLESVNSKLNAVRRSSDAHTSEQDPRYTTMLMTQQVLESYIAEEEKDDKKLPPWLKKGKDEDKDDSDKDSDDNEKDDDKDSDDDADDKKKKDKGNPFAKKDDVKESKKVPPAPAKNNNKGKLVGEALTADERAARAGKGGSPLTADERAARAGKGGSPLTADERAARARKGGSPLTADERAARDKSKGKTKPKKVAETSEARNKRYVKENKFVDLHIRKLLSEDQVTQAQSVMAAKDMVDSIQDMLEDLSKMLNEQLPPLIDNIRANIGETQASGFQQSASNSLENLLQSAQSAREEINNAVLSLTGEGPTPVTMPDEMPPRDMQAPNMDDNEDEFGASDAAVGGELPMGREKR